MRKIELPCFDIVVRVSDDRIGSISSSLHEENSSVEYETAIDALESIIVAHACAGVNIESYAYIEGIETAVESILNHYDV